MASTAPTELPTRPPEPSTPKKKRLTRDQRRDILLMRRLGYSYKFIAEFIKVSQRAVQYTCNTQISTPQFKNAGRPPRLSTEEVDQLEEYMLQSPETRRMTYLQLAEELWPEGEVGADSVRYALHARGYRRRVALRKPPLSKTN
jgi:transposase